MNQNDQRWATVGTRRAPGYNLHEGRKSQVPRINVNLVTLENSACTQGCFRSELNICDLKTQGIGTHINNNGSNSLICKGRCKSRRKT